MTILADKILTLLAMPLGLGLIGLAIAAVAQVLDRRRIAKLAAIASVGLIWTFSTPYVAHILARELENRIPTLPVNLYPVADVAVLLGGTLSVPDNRNSYFDIHEAGDRIIHAARLYREGRARKIIVSGGNVFDGEILPEGEVIADFLVFIGVSRDDIIVDGSSRNTRENALNTASIWREAGFGSGFLVTSALHMPRAIAAFQMTGLDLIPAPIDYLSADTNEPFPLPLLPDAGSLRLSSSVIKEWLGLLVYRWRGWA